MTTRSEANRRGVGVRALLLALTLAASTATTAWGQCQTQKLLASDGQPNRLFARSIAVDGEWAAFGDPARDSSRGSIYMFRVDGGRWIEQAILDPPDSRHGDGLGESVALSATLLVAGAPGRNTGVSGGAALPLEWDGIAWVPQGWLAPNRYTHVDSRFGKSVETNGTTILVGAPAEGLNSEQGSGRVHSFLRTGESWVHEQLLNPSDRPSRADFGTSLAMEGDTLVVGAPGHPGNGNDPSGAAYVFTRIGGAWVEQQILTPSQVEGAAEFGHAVAIGGGRIVIGARRDSQYFNGQSGSAFAFEYSGSQWTEVQRIAPPQPENGGLFGSAVSISGETLVIGAEDTPAAYSFTRSGGEWILADTMIPSDGAAGFGGSAAISGGRALLGSYDGAGLRAAYEFAVGVCPPFALGEPAPGRAGTINRWIVDGVPVSDRAYFIYGFRSGQTSIPGCGGLTASIAHAVVFGSGRAGDSGRVTLSQFVPESARGRIFLFQVVDPSSCRVSNVIEYRFE